MKKILFSILVLFLGLFTVGCSEGDDSSDKLQVAVTILPEVGLVKEVAGDLVDVKLLVPKGASPETYEATPKDVADFKEADIYFSIGVPAEGAKFISEDEDLNIVKLHDKVNEVYEKRYFEEDSYDHHIWLSIKRAIIMVEVIGEELSKLDPDNSSTYMENVENYKGELEELDKGLEGKFSSKENKEFIVFHPALGYFADDYGLTMYALEEEGKEATPSHLTDLIELGKEKNIKGLLINSEVDTKQGETFAKEIDGKLIVIELLSEDYYYMMNDLGNKVEEVL